MEDKLQSTINVAPNTEFEEGTRLNLAFKVGTAYDEAIQNEESYVKTAPITLRLQLKLLNPEAFEAVSATLSGIKDMVFSMIGPLADGVGVEFKQHESYIYVDVHYSGAYTEMLSQFSFVSQIFSAGTFGGKSSLAFSTEASPVDALTETLPSLFSKLMKFKINFEGCYTHLKALTDFAETMKDLIPEDFQKFLFLGNVLNFIKQVNFNYVYDAAVFEEFVKSAVNHSKKRSVESEQTFFERQSTKFVEKYQPGMNQTVQGGAMMAQSVLASFTDAIKSINFDEFSVKVFANLIKTSPHLCLYVRGLNSTIHTTLGI